MTVEERIELAAGRLCEEGFKPYRLTLTPSDRRALFAEAYPARIEPNDLPRVKQPRWFYKFERRWLEIWDGDGSMIDASNAFGHGRREDLPK